MADTWLTQIDMSGLEIYNMRLHNSVGGPAGVNSPGGIYFDTGSNSAKINMGSSVWADLMTRYQFPATFTGFTTLTGLTASVGSGGDGSAQLLLGIANGGVGTAQLADGSVTNVKIASGVSADKIIAGSTNGVYTLTEKTKLAGIATGATANSSDATLLNRANHTGSQLAATISDFAAQVAARSISVFTAPTVDLNMNAKKITNMMDPVNASDAATKNYVDNAVQGLSAKDAVWVATTANITLSGTQTIDNISVAAGQRVLVKNQTAAADNGIYVASAGAWTRALDADSTADMDSAYVWVDEGSQGDTGWLMNQNMSGFVVGTTAQTWIQFSGAGQVIAGNGLQKSGNTLSVLVYDAGGVGQSGIDVGAVGMRLSTYIPRGGGLQITGNGTTTSFPITSPAAFLQPQSAIVVVSDASSGKEVHVDVVKTTTGITLGFGVAPANGKVYNVYIAGGTVA